MIFRNRGYLPHLEDKGATYFVTFRLAGTLPAEILANWKFEREDIEQEAQRQVRELSEYERQRLADLYSTRIEDYLDQHHGECWLRNPLVAGMVINALKHFDAARHDMHAFCVMPNHVHTVFTPIPDPGKLTSELIPILHSWKSFTSHKANQILKRKGKFWQEDYYDRVIRSDEDFAHSVQYTLQNPVKAGLCKTWSDWPWCGCSETIWKMLQD